MKALVVDASVAVKWVVEEAHSEAAARLQGLNLAAPDLLLTECANVLWVKARRGELTRAEATQRIDLLTEAPVELVSPLELLPTAVSLAFDLDHPIYDCLYLALAVLRRQPLVTADRRFVSAVREHSTHAERVLYLGDLMSFP